MVIFSLLLICLSECHVCSSSEAHCTRNSALQTTSVSIVPDVGFGTAFFELCGGDGQRPCVREVDDDGWEYVACLSCIEQALEVGFRHFDVAELYDGSEKTLRQASSNFELQRDALYITSKVMPGNDGYTFAGSLRSFNGSLARLGVEYLDLYLLHWAAPGWRSAWKALETLHKEGRVRAIGVSNFNRSLLESLVYDPSVAVLPSAVQNFVDIRYQYKDYRAWCKQHDITYIAYSTLTYIQDDDSSTARKYAESRRVLQRISSHHGKTTQQVILRWALQAGMHVIPKTRKKNHMKENFSGLNFTLSEHEMEVIAQLDQPQERLPPSDDCEMMGDLVVC